MFGASPTESDRRLSEFLRDPYFALLSGSWWRLFAIVVSSYLAINLLFAGLYLLDPTGIGGTAGLTAIDAFAFSVQTLATIGYGAMHPTSPWSHFLVATEALLGLVSTAVMTGLVFAKLSRPVAGIVFSEVATISDRNGVPTLAVRLANQRSNLIAEAEIRLTVLRDETTREGERLRKLIDLSLERSRTPMFALSWTVYHPIDATSPLAGLGPEDLERQIVMIIASVIGHDLTYGQTVHARYAWRPADLRFGHRFADVLSPGPDGRIQIDYGPFHDTRAIEAPRRLPAPSGTGTSTATASSP